jgi:methionyl-tRNA formyltransferase
MRVVFIGSSSFGLKCLKEIDILKELKVVGVVTAPSEFKISYSKDKVKNVLHSDFSNFCKSNFIPFKIMKEKMNEDGLFNKVEEWNPDIFIVAGWYHMIPKKWLQYKNSYGLHASLLPDYSGGAPLVWSIINGEKKTGITLFQMDAGVDSGPILGQAEETIFDEDDISTLYSRIEERGLELIRNCLPLLALGKLALIEQDESKRRIFPQRSPNDGIIDLNLSNIAIKNFIRAQTKPYPGAFLINKTNSKKLIIWDCNNIFFKHNEEVGSVIKYDNSWAICCYDGLIIPKLVNYDDQDTTFKPEYFT